MESHAANFKEKIVCKSNLILNGLSSKIVEGWYFVLNQKIEGQYIDDIHDSFTDLFQLETLIKKMKF